MKKFIALSLILVSALFISGCDFEDSDTKIEKKTEQIMREINAQVGMPAVTNFQEKKLAKMIFELRDREDLTTYTYFVNWQGELIFLGESIGYGLPYSIQYTNPMKYEYNGTTLPQADPNGLFMPDGLSATWVMLKDPTTKEVRPVYVEQEIIVSPFKLK